MDEHTHETVDIGDSVIFQALHDEVVLLNLVNHEYYGLDSVGADVWQLLLKHRSVTEAAKALQGMYAVDEEMALRDVRKLVDELLASGLLRKVAAA